MQSAEVANRLKLFWHGGSGVVLGIGVLLWCLLGSGVLDGLPVGLYGLMWHNVSHFGGSAVASVARVAACVVFGWLWCKLAVWCGSVFAGGLCWC